MREYLHSSVVEQRMFHLDIEALKQHSKAFADAYEGDGTLNLAIGLDELFELAPRKHKAVKQYRRLQRYLSDRGIGLQIVSRKSRRLANEEVADDVTSQTNKPININDL